MTLRKLFLNTLAAAICLSVVPAVLTACDDDDDLTTTWEKYAEWRNKNETWLNSQTSLTGPDGKPLFTKIVPTVNPSGIVYMRWFGDRNANNANLQPLYTSTVTVNYAVYLYDGTRVDSAANYTVQLNSQSLIPGWATSIQQMHVNDTVEVLMPYNVAYGASGSGEVLPYSTLRFNLRLVDIPNYETRP